MPEATQLAPFQSKSTAVLLQDEKKKYMFPQLHSQVSYHEGYSAQISFVLKSNHIPRLL